MRLLPTLSILVLCACSGSQDVIRTNQADYPATNSESVKLYIDSAAVKSAYQEIGIVRVELESSVAGEPVEDAEVIRKLKARAAELGADGIILEAIFADTKGISVNSRADYVEHKRGRAIAIRTKH